MYLYKNQKTDLLKFEVDEEKNTFLIHLNKAEVMTECWRLTKEILLKIQVYKSTADVNAARDFYNEYSAVSEEFLKIRKIVIANWAPQRVTGSHNLIEVGSDIKIASYEATHEGLILSFVDRFAMTRDFCELFIAEWNKYAHFIRV